jgi:hypothetical protein
MIIKKKSRSLLIYNAANSPSAAWQPARTEPRNSGHSSLATFGVTKGKGKGKGKGKSLYYIVTGLRRPNHE